MCVCVWRGGDGYALYSHGNLYIKENGLENKLVENIGAHDSAQGFVKMLFFYSQHPTKLPWLLPTIHKIVKLG